LSISNNLFKFYKRRFFRLAPALFIVLLFSAILISFFAPTSSHQKFANQGFAVMFLIGNLGAYRYQGDYFDPNPNSLVHLWSLSVEEQIYILIPLLGSLFFLAGKTTKDIRMRFLSLMILGTFLSLISFLNPLTFQPIYSFFNVSMNSDLAFYLPINRLWQFTVGSILFLITKETPKRESSNSYLYLTIVAPWFLVLILFGTFRMNQQLVTLVTTTLTLIVVKNRSLDFLPKKLIFGLVWLGNRSYSIYLVHMPIIYLLLNSPHFHSIVPKGEVLKFCLLVFLSLLVGHMAYTKVEMRYRESHDHTNTKSDLLKIFICSTAVFILLGVLRYASINNILKDPNIPTSAGVKSWNWDPECSFHSSETIDKRQPCLYFNGVGKNYLLIGDSHSASLSKTMVSISKLNNANIFVWTHTSCPFITKKNAKSTKLDLVSESCLKHNQRILQFLQNTEIDTIFYTQRSSSSYVKLSLESNLSQFRFQILQGLATLEQYASELIFVGVTPEYVDSFTFLNYLRKDEGKFSELPWNDNQYWKKVLKASKTHYVDIYSVFCRSKTWCVNQLDGQWLFEDLNHLSILGGQLVMPSIQEILDISKLNSMQ
jgi:peptidoglycan/LPS O-acetylase OafA/YrhL